MHKIYIGIFTLQYVFSPSLFIKNNKKITFLFCECTKMYVYIYKVFYYMLVYFEISLSIT